MKRALFIVAALLVSGCAGSNEWGEQAAEYIPLVGERCHNFQCIMDDSPVGWGNDEYIPQSYPNPDKTPASASSAPQRKSFPPPQ